MCLPISECDQGDREMTKQETLPGKAAWLSHDVFEQVWKEKGRKKGYFK